MENQAQNHDSPLPPYEQWPPAPKTPLRSWSYNGESCATNLNDANSKDGQGLRATSVPSMDDIEAAQALEGLRADIKYSPQPRQPNDLPSKFDPALSGSQNLRPNPRQQEPLLSILTSQHPLLSTAVKRSLSAYSTSKSYSPSFKYGAEFVERHIGSPVVSTVETASRISGVETGVRWWLQRRNSNNPNRSKKRRLEDLDGERVDVERGLRDFKAQINIQETLSELSFAEPLPAYDDHRSPNYEEKESMDDQNEISRSRFREWQQRIMVYTSGLGVSLSEESLRSLRHCLEWLKWANQNLNNNIRALHEVLDRNVARKRTESSESSQKETQPGKVPPKDPAGISRYVDALDQSVRSILKEAISVVNRFTGNALPDNARQLVRRYITSFPLSFRIVNTLCQQDPEFGFPGFRPGQPSETDARTRRAILFAREGLNMLVQITGVLDGTIASANQWVDRLERRGSEERDGSDEIEASNATNSETADEIMPDQPMNIITVSEIEIARNEDSAHGGLAIRTSGELGMPTNENSKPLIWLSRNEALVNKASTDGNGATGGAQMNGNQINWISRNGRAGNNAPSSHTSTNGNSAYGTPADGISAIREPPEPIPRPRIRNPLAGTTPPILPDTDAETSGDEIQLNGNLTDRELTNGHAITPRNLSGSRIQGRVHNGAYNLPSDASGFPPDLGDEHYSLNPRPSTSVRNNPTPERRMPRVRLDSSTLAPWLEPSGFAHIEMQNGINATHEDPTYSPPTSIEPENMDDSTTGLENSNTSNSEEHDGIRNGQR